jgi:hypothetical protein
VITVLGRDEAAALTAPHHELWIAAHLKAEKVWWDEIRQYSFDAFNSSRPATRASILHDVIVREVEDRGGSAIAFSHGLGFFTQIITGERGGVLVRFKMLGSDFRTQNHRSGQQDVLDSQILSTEILEQLDLAEIPSSLTVLTCGYQLSADQMTISNVAVVCHHERNVIYSYFLENERGTGGVEILGLPIPDGPPPSEVRSKRREPEQPTLF